MKNIHVLLLLTLVLSACEFLNTHSDVRQWMDERVKTIQPGIKPLPELKPFEPITYNSSDLMDPFSPAKISPEKSALNAKNRPDLSRRREDLEKFALDGIKFVGLIRNESSSVEAVMIADRKVYRVKEGNYLGQNFGRITKIESSPELDRGRIILREQYQEANGDWAYKGTAIELQSAEKK